MAEINGLSASKKPNFLSAGIAQSAGSGTGRIEWSPANGESDAAFTSGVTTFKAGGGVFVLCIGGGGDGGITLTNGTQENEMFTTIVAICDKYGFTGIDWDLESDRWSPASAANVSRRLRAHYGRSFLIGASPRPFEMNSSGVYRNLFLNLGKDNLDFANYQHYDFPETRDDTFLKNYIKSRCTELVNLGIPADRYIAGAITWTGYALGWNEPEVYRDGILATRAQHPTMRGVMLWETKLAKVDNYYAWSVFNASLK